MKIIWLCNLHNTWYIKVLPFYEEWLKNVDLYDIYVTDSEKIGNRSDAGFSKQTDDQHNDSGHKNAENNCLGSLF